MTRETVVIVPVLTGNSDLHTHVTSTPKAITETYKT